MNYKTNIDTFAFIIKMRNFHNFHMWLLILTYDHSIDIYISCRCQCASQLPHLGKYFGNYASSNLRSPGSHSHATVVPGRCLGTTPHSKLSYLLAQTSKWGILEHLKMSHHELCIANGLTLMTLSPCGWEAFPTPGALIHARITWAFSPLAPQVLGVTVGSPL